MISVLGVYLSIPILVLDRALTLHSDPVAIDVLSLPVEVARYVALMRVCVSFT